MNSQEHKPCKDWTIKIEQWGMIFYITDILFQDIADSARKGIQVDNPNATVTVYKATNIKAE